MTWCKPLHHLFRLIVFIKGPICTKYSELNNKTTMISHQRFIWNTDFSNNNAPACSPFSLLSVVRRFGWDGEGVHHRRTSRWMLRDGLLFANNKWIHVRVGIFLAFNSQKKTVSQNITLCWARLVFHGCLFSVPNLATRVSFRSRMEVMERTLSMIDDVDCPTRFKTLNVSILHIAPLK